MITQARPILQTDPSLRSHAKHSIFANGFGSFSTLFSLLGYLGCLFIAFGVTIRVMAVATLKKQFTAKVSI